MHTEVIPAILVKSKRELFKRFDIANAFAKTIQIDIMDGLFVDNETPRPLNDGTWFRRYIVTKKRGWSAVELHLMTINPWEIIQQWKELDYVKRIIWHEEVPIDHAALIRAVHDLDMQACLALNPETPLKQIVPYIEQEPRKRGASRYYADSVLVMGVKPGFSGQPFKLSALKAIRVLRKQFPHLPIAVDGGVNWETAPMIVKAGANRLNAAGAIFQAKDPKQAYKILSNI